MSTMKVMRGFAQDIDWTIESAPGVPLDLTPYNACRVSFDDAKGAIDKLTVEASIMQAGTDPDFVNKGLVRFELEEADTLGWEGDVRIRYQFALRATATSKWYGCLHEPVLVHDRVADATVFESLEE